MDLTNRKVLMKKRIAKWYLDTPEIYTNGLTWDKNYEPETYVHLACCFDIPIYGKVLREGNDGWVVRFKLGSTTIQYCIDRKDFTLVSL